MNSQIVRAVRQACAANAAADGMVPHPDCALGAMTYQCYSIAAEATHIGHMVTDKAASQHRLQILRCRCSEWRKLG